MRYIGVHVSISGGVEKAIDRILELETNCGQIFLKSSNQWQGKGYTPQQIKGFRDGWQAHPDLQIFAHSSYLINLAGEGENYDKSVAALTDELIRADQLGIKWIVLHPGSHKGMGEQWGLERIAATIRQIFSNLPADNQAGLLLEATAGQGSNLGYTFEQLAELIRLINSPERIGVCLDSCHIFTAGYELRSPEGYNRTIEQFDSIIGLEQLKLIHLNDSKFDLASKKDRHEHLGEGLIGREGLANLLQDRRLLQVPLVLETPMRDENSDRENLNYAKALWLEG